MINKQETNSLIVELVNLAKVEYLEINMIDKKVYQHINNAN